MYMYIYICICMCMDDLTNTFYTCFFDILVTSFSSVKRAGGAWAVAATKTRIGRWISVRVLHDLAYA